MTTACRVGSAIATAAYNRTRIAMMLSTLSVLALPALFRTESAKVMSDRTVIDIVVMKSNSTGTGIIEKIKPEEGPLTR